MENKLGLMTKAAFAEIMQVSARTVDGWVATNKVPYVRIGKRTYIDTKKYRDILDNRNQTD